MTCKTLRSVGTSKELEPRASCTEHWDFQAEQCVLTRGRDRIGRLDGV